MYISCGIFICLTGMMDKMLHYSQYSILWRFSKAQTLRKGMKQKETGILTLFFPVLQL